MEYGKSSKITFPFQTHFNLCLISFDLIKENLI